MAKRSSMRASDADRDRVAERLRQAAAEGRLLAHELEERMATALRARTYGELDDIVDDLPHSEEPPRQRTAGRPYQTSGLNGYLRRRYPVYRMMDGTGAIGILAAVLVIFLVAMAALAALISTTALLIPAGVLMLMVRGSGPRRSVGRRHGGRRIY